MNRCSKNISDFKFAIQKFCLAKTALVKRLNNEISNLKLQCSIIAQENLNNKLCFKMQGNLGNQMFIHAAAISQKINLSSLFYDISECNYVLDKYGITTPVSNYNYEKALEKSYIHEFISYDCYDAEFSKTNLYLKGYFQNEKYFLHNREQIIKEFTFPVTDSLEYQTVLNDIVSSNSVLLNFRVKKDYYDLGWVIDFAYHRNAMDYIAKQVESPKFFVFADDINYVKNNFVCDYDIEYVDIEKENPNKIFIDLELMKKCKHAIIPNSSFSWWAAWLNQNPDKIIIAPDPWFYKESGIVPDSWVKLSAPKLYCKAPRFL